MNCLHTTVAAFFLLGGLVLPAQGGPPTDGALRDSSDVTVVMDRAGAPDEGEADDASDPAATSAQEDEPSLSVSVGGSLRFNTLFRAYNTPFEEVNDRILRDGGFTFDTFRIGAGGSYGGLIFDTEYAVYPESFGGLFIHHGWVGYKFSDRRQFQVGVSQVPFGIQPYASSSWFFNGTYYVGLEDDYDAGIKALFTLGNWELQGAYYMNAEQTDFFAGSDFSRYSYDVAPVSSARYQVVPGGNDLRSDLSERHQFNLKVAYTVDHGALGSTNLGVSAQAGQLLNQSVGRSGEHGAVAVHLHGRYGGFEAKLQVARQEFDPPLTDAEMRAFAAQSGVEYAADEFVVMGAYAFPQRVASEHTVYSSSLAYHLPVELGPVSEFKPYYDFSAVTKSVDGWNDNVTHNIGVLVSAGPLFVYTDLNVSKGHPFNHPADGFASVMAENSDNTWRTAFNMNIGLYF